MHMKIRAIGHGQRLDEAQIRRAFQVITLAGFKYEIRAAPSERRRYLDGVVGDVLKCISSDHQSGDLQFYLGVNPLPASFTGQDGRAKKEHILRREWFVIDVDPVRAEGFEKDSATDEEHDAAKATACAVQSYLSDQGWPDPVEIDSGNGWYLVYKCSMEVNHSIRVDEGQAALGRLLVHLQKKFDSPQAEIDSGMHYASVRLKIPGTFACKGPGTAERPHRQCKLVHVPEDIEEVNFEQIVALAGPETARKKPKSKLVVRMSGGQGRSYALAALKRECAKMRAAKGTRTLNATLWRCACALGEFVPLALLSEGEILEALYEAALDAGCDNERKDKDTILRGIRQGSTNPRQIPLSSPPPRIDPAKPERNGTHDPLPPGGKKKRTISAAEIEPKSVNFLWAGRLPQGKLVTFAGMGGLGKTFVLCDLAARISIGAEWPFSNGECAPLGDTLFISGEDDSDDTLVPRIIEMGGDRSHIHFLTVESEDEFSLHDISMMDEMAEEIGPSLKFVVIDPPTSYLGGVDDHKNSELRALLRPLKNWAAKRKVCMVFNTHITKGGAQKVEAMMRVMGSVAWCNTVRVAHMFAKDPEDPGRRLFLCMKSNAAEESGGLAYRIAKTDALARVEWLGKVDITADEAMNKEKRKKLVNVYKWLEEQFTESDQVPSVQIWGRMESTTLKKHEVQEAKDKMGVRARQQADPEGGRSWVWVWSQEDRERWNRRKALMANSTPAESKEQTEEF
jgi:hypothetical protein